MGMMTKMRDNAHLFILAFIVIFVAFWVFTDLDVGSITRGSQNEIGVFDGKPVTYQEFQQLVEQLVEQRRTQNKGQEVDENTLTSIREQVWGDYLTRAVINRAVKEIGITVADEEIMDWLRSDQPPEVIIKNFTDSTGRFNRDAYQQFLNNPGAVNSEALIQLEKQLKDDLIRQKLTTALAGSFQVSDQDLREKFLEQTMQVSANYLLFEPQVFAARDTAAPSEQEYRDYYEKNKKQYKVKETRKLKFVLFPDKPSKGDSTAIRNLLGSILDDAHKGVDFLQLVKDNSEAPYQDNWVNRSQMDVHAADSVFGKPVGSLVGPVPTEAGYSVFKIMDVRNSSEPMIQASHILFRTDGGQSDASQKAKCEDVLRKARAGEDFTALAKKYSEEPGASERGGALGWFGKGRMVPEFEAAAMKAKVGEIVGPVKTQFGYHIIKVTGRSSEEVKVAEIRMSVKAGSRTRDEIFERARNFAYFANEHGFEQEAKLDSLPIRETPDFSKQTGSYIPNIGVNPALMKFAFDNKVGALSEVHRGSNGYIVSQISDMKPEGYKPLDEIREQIRPQVVHDRQMEKTLDVARSFAKSHASLAEIATRDPSLKVDSTHTFTLANGAPVIGKDEALAGVVLRLRPGETSAPFRGLRGTYMVQLLSKTAFDETAYKVKKDELRKQQIQQLQNEFIQSWLEEQKEHISVVDNRDRFMR